MRPEEDGVPHLYGANRPGFNLEMHEAILGPGAEARAPHTHMHEERHSVRNAGGTPCSYLCD
jgi:hypothetical protein